MTDKINSPITDNDVPEYDDLRSTVPSRTRGMDVARAFFKIATANHYLVGLHGPVTEDELIEARQILIGWQNHGIGRGLRHQRLDLALDLIDLELKPK